MLYFLQFAFLIEENSFFSDSVNLDQHSLLITFGEAWVSNQLVGIGAFVLLVCDW